MAKEDDPIIKTTIRLKRSLLNAVKHRAIDNGQDRNGILILALAEYLGKKGGR